MISEAALFFGGPVGLRDLFEGRLVFFFGKAALFFSMIIAATFLDKNSVLPTLLTALVLGVWLSDLIYVESNFALFAALFAAFVAVEFF